MNVPYDGEWSAEKFVSAQSTIQGNSSQGHSTVVVFNKLNVYYAPKGTSLQALQNRKEKGNARDD